MELPSTEAIQEAQKDLEEKTKEYGSWLIRNATLRLGGLIGVIGITPLVTDSSLVSIFSGGLCGWFAGTPLSNLKKGRAYQNSQPLITLHDNGTLSFREGNGIEYNSLLLQSSPQRYLPEQHKLLSEYIQELEKERQEQIQVNLMNFGLESEIDWMKQFVPEEKLGQLEKKSRFRLSLRSALRGTTLKTQVKEILLFYQMRLSKCRLENRVADYGVEFYQRAGEVLPRESYPALTLCQEVSGELQQSTQDLALRRQKYFESVQRLYARFCPAVVGSF